MDRRKPCNAIEWAPAITWVEPMRPIGLGENLEAQWLGTVEIAGALHHIEAAQVKDQDGEQGPVCPDDEMYGQIAAITKDRMVTVERDNREYVLIVTPYQD